MVRIEPTPPRLAFLAAPKSEIQFNGVGGLRTYISYTHSAKAENERSSAVGRRNVGDSIRRRDVSGWAVVYRK
jgi:hypothetical protein